MKAIAATWLALTFAVGCKDEAPSPTPDVLEFEVCGSSTMGARLMPRLVAAWLGLPSPLPELKFRNGPNWQSKPGQPPGYEQRIRIRVRYGGSGDAVERLHGGSCALGMLSGPVPGLSDFHTTEVGEDAILIVAAPTAPIAEVSVGHLARWYSGERQERPAHLMMKARAEPTSGTSLALAEALGLEQLHVEPWDLVPADGFDALINAKGRWLYYVSTQEQVSSADFKVLAVRKDASTPAVSPTPATWRERYPIIRPLRLAYDRRKAQEPVRAFVRWVESAEARPIFEALGLWHRTSAELDHAPIPESCTPDGPRAISGHARTPYYFDSGAQTTEDPMARGRLQLDLRRALRNHGDLVLVGYASDEGPRQKNCALALGRAVSLQTLATAELDRIAAGATERPALRAVAGGPTRFWSQRPEYNRVVMVMEVSR